MQCKRKPRTRHRASRSGWTLCGTIWVSERSIQPSVVPCRYTNQRATDQHYRSSEESYRRLAEIQYSPGSLSLHMPYLREHCSLQCWLDWARGLRVWSRDRCRGWAGKTVDCLSHPLKHESLCFCHRVTILPLFQQFFFTAVRALMDFAGCWIYWDIFKISVCW